VAYTLGKCKFVHKRIGKKIVELFSVIFTQKRKKKNRTATKEIIGVGV
jgi:hypothetical protein